MRLENPTSQPELHVMFVHYADGSLQKRFFNSERVLSAWEKTMKTLMSLQAVARFTIFPIAYLPQGKAFTT